MSSTRILHALVMACIVCFASCTSEAESESAVESAPNSAPASPTTSELAITPSTISIAGQTISLVRAPGANTNKQTVLFLHGAAYSAQTWVDNTVLAQVSGHGIDAIAIDLPGFGESQRTDLANDEFLAALFLALKLDPAMTIVVSPSMSGGFSLPVLRDPFFADLAGYVPVAPVGIAAFIQSGQPVSVPALVIWGDGDGSNPQAAAEELAATFVTSTVLILPDAGHAAYQQQPDLFAGALIEFAGQQFP